MFWFIVFLIILAIGSGFLVVDDIRFDHSMLDEFFNNLDEFVTGILGKL